MQKVYYRFLTKADGLIRKNAGILSLAGLVILMVCLVGMFIFLQPKIESQFFPTKRAQVWQYFFHLVEQKQAILPQDFWEFRERFSPGFFVFNDGLASVAGILNLHKLPTGSGRFSLLQYNSDYLKSNDQIINKNNLTKAWQSILQSHHPRQTIFSNQFSSIFYDDSGNLWIVFVKPVEEMRTTNGFFDYTGAEKEILTDYYWLDETRILAGSY